MLMGCPSHMGVLHANIIWTYAAALYDHNNMQTMTIYDCPCKQNNTIIAPPFIGTDYYCESGATELLCHYYLFERPSPGWAAVWC